MIVRHVNKTYENRHTIEETRPRILNASSMIVQNVYPLDPSFFNSENDQQRLMLGQED